MPTLFRNAFEILDRHVRLSHGIATLIALNAGDLAQAAFAVLAVSHNPHINQVRIRSHKRVGSGVFAVFVQHAGTHIEAGFGVKVVLEVVFLVMYCVAH